MSPSASIGGKNMAVKVAGRLTIKEKREPNGSLRQLIPCMQVLVELERIIDPLRKAHA